MVAIPGRYFSARAGDPQFKCKSARMAFCNLSEDELREGGRRFAAVLRRYSARRAGLPSGPASAPPAADFGKAPGADVELAMTC